MASRSLGSLVILLLVASWISTLPGQDKTPQSVWDGIYTVEQAARGEASYTEACASCHGERLDGQGQAPPLAGSEFASNWNGSSVADLFERVQVSMPADRPGQLTKDENARILAYIFKVNKFPSGSKELPASADALKGVRIEAQRTAK